MPPRDPSPPLFAPGLGEGGFEPYLRALRRHPLIVALVALSVTVGAGAWLLLRPPAYRATAQVLVTPAVFDDYTYNGLPIVRDTSSDPTRATQTAAAMLDAPAAAGAAATALGGSWTAARVRAAVTVLPEGGSNVLDVQATAAQSAGAVRVADAFAAAALALRRQSLRRQAATLIAQLRSTPGLPARELNRLEAVTEGFDPSFSSLHGAVAATPARGPAWRTLSMALFAGVVLGVALVLLGEGALRALRERRRRSQEQRVSDPAPGALLVGGVEEPSVPEMAAPGDVSPR